MAYCFRFAPEALLACTPGQLSAELHAEHISAAYRGAQKDAIALYCLSFHTFGSFDDPLICSAQVWSALLVLARFGAFGAQPLHSEASKFSGSRWILVGLLSGFVIFSCFVCLCLPLCLMLASEYTFCLILSSPRQTTGTHVVTT